MKIHVGNLSPTTADGDLRLAFEAFGKVDSSRVVMDKVSNVSKGFGFVEMGDQAHAQAAITGLTGKELKGNAVTVSEARAHSDSNEAKPATQPEEKKVL